MQADVLTFLPNFKLLFGTISQTVVWSNLISLQLAAADGKNTHVISTVSLHPSENRNFSRGKQRVGGGSNNNSQCICFKSWEIQLLLGRHTVEQANITRRGIITSYD
jgi:hypothetical protein